MGGVRGVGGGGGGMCGVASSTCKRNVNSLIVVSQRGLCHTNLFVAVFFNTEHAQSQSLDLT